MSVLHRIKLPPKRKSRQVVVSDLGDWECCADEVHSFSEPMVQLTVPIDADHILHMFCEADQVDAAIAALRDRLTGKPEATHAAAGSAPATPCVTFSTPNHLPTSYAMTIKSTLYYLGQKVETLSREDLIAIINELHQENVELRADRDRWKRSGDPLRHLLNA